MYCKTLAGILLCFLLPWYGNFTHAEERHEETSTVIKPVLAGIHTIPLPPGFTRKSANPGSFAAWLRKIPMKDDKIVYLYNGKRKANQQAQFAVLEISVGETDLQQCADAVIRLRAEYLFSAGRFNEIFFKDNADTHYRFSAPFTRENFDRFLRRVFGMCGTASLAKQMKPIGMNELAAGDALVRGGFPGHAVMVMDVAENSTGKRIYLLAQSYMPAQDIHILKNPLSLTPSPWYFLKDDDFIVTPEYRFKKTELKRW